MLQVANKGDLPDWYGNVTAYRADCGLCQHQQQAHRLSWMACSFLQAQTYYTGLHISLANNSLKLTH